MLTRVYRHLLQDRPMRNVLPVPESSLDAQELDCREMLEDNWQSFVRCASPAKGPADAATAEDIEKQVANRLGVDRVAAQLLLQGRGFERIRSKAQGRNVYFYRYNFSVCGAKVLKPLYVKTGSLSRPPRLSSRPALFSLSHLFSGAVSDRNGHGWPCMLA
jgi:hypothetical protein